MSVSFNPGQPIDDVFLGNVRESDQAAAKKADTDGDNILTKREMYDAYVKRLPRGAPIPDFATWKPKVRLEHNVAPKDLSKVPVWRQPTARDLAVAGEPLGDFHIDGMGFGNARFRRMVESPSREAPSGRDVCYLALDLGGFDPGMVLDKGTKFKLVIAPRDFRPDSTDRLGLADAVFLPMTASVQAPSHGRMGYQPGVKAAMVAVDTRKLRELAEGSDRLGFYVEIEAKGHPKRYANLGGEPFQNFMLPTSKLQ